MIEHNEPQRVYRPDLCYTYDIVAQRRAQAPDHVAFHVSEYDSSNRNGSVDYRDITMTEFSTVVDRIALSLIQSGLNVGQPCIIMASTSYEWALAEWGIWRAGGVVVPVYETSPVEILAHIVKELDVQIAFVSDAIVDKLMLEQGNLSKIHIVSIEKISEFAAQCVTERDVAMLDSRARDREDVASIVYTSGTTGQPRGSRILHRNFIDLVLNVQAAWSDVLNDRGRTVIFLPLAHVLARGLQMICMWAGMRITYMADPRNLIAALPAIQPTFIVAVPRVFHKILEATRHKAQAKYLGPLWSRAERHACNWGALAEEADLKNIPLSTLASLPQRLEHVIFDRLFFNRIRHLLGGCMEFILSGAAPLDRNISLMFRGFGLPVMEGYGLTETTAPLSGNRPGRIRSGSVGELIPGTTVRIAEDGSILVKGIGVSPGYIDSQATDEAYKDGFFNTGDLGEIRDGYLYITGRAKDMLVTAGGKTIAPAKWEALVEAHPWIEHAVMVGDNMPYVAALLVLDKQNLAENFKDILSVIPQTSQPKDYRIVTDERIVTELHKVVELANKHVSRADGVKRFQALLADLDQESGLITPTLKIKRGKVLEYFSEIVQAIYRRKN
ncbi:AMP-dependent synthetase/ligase [Arcanobacterium pinnipediorum]|uniref:AMP-dependent synthetase/ligase n=1 Tax=Arcanobacterium pinnipediorum TaxID=1503041 RepID=A0ABY5AFD1_9ACTO|nr:AMP-dependent synthetase/ligase [Arcanobacterium pinnipediorum]USR78715.1 AMP-dependent synthetase/ligase [Arcanobacterium pinnipediorum]